MLDKSCYLNIEPFNIPFRFTTYSCAFVYESVEHNTNGAKYGVAYFKTNFPVYNLFFLYFHRSYGDLFECKIELQLKNNLPDVNTLTNASYCYIIDEEFCLLQDLVVRRGKSLSKYKYIYLQFLDMYAIRHIKIKTIAI